MTIQSLRTIICAAAVMVSMAAAQSAMVHDHYSKLSPSVDPNEISLAASLVNIVAIAIQSIARPPTNPSNPSCGSLKSATHNNLLSEMPPTVVIPTIDSLSLSNRNSSGPILVSGVATSMATDEASSLQRSCNVTSERLSQKTKPANLHLRKIKYSARQYDSAPFAGAGALIGAALLF